MLKSHGSGNSSSKKVTSSTSSSSSNGSVDVRKNSVDQFLCQSYDLCPAGELQHSQSFPFLFRDLSKRYESYKGKNVDVAYYVKVTVMRKSTDISKIKRFWVYLYNSVTTAPNTLSANETKATTNDIAGGNYAADNAVTTRKQRAPRVRRQTLIKFCRYHIQIMSPSLLDWI